MDQFAILVLRQTTELPFPVILSGDFFTIPLTCKWFIICVQFHDDLGGTLTILIVFVIPDLLALDRHHMLGVGECRLCCFLLHDHAGATMDELMPFLTHLFAVCLISIHICYVILDQDLACIDCGDISTCIRSFLNYLIFCPCWQIFDQNALAVAQDKTVHTSHKLDYTITADSYSPFLNLICRLRVGDIGTARAEGLIILIA